MPLAAGGGLKQPSQGFLCLNPLRLEAGDSSRLARVPEPGAKGLSPVLSEAFMDRHLTIRKSLFGRQTGGAKAAETKCRSGYRNSTGFAASPVCW